MHLPLFPVPTTSTNPATSRLHASAHRRRPGRRRWLGALLAGALLATGVPAQETPAPAAKDDFMPLVQLAPFVVNGKSLAISIYARTRSDRRYGEEFAEGVAKIVYEAVTENTGKGLVIIGAKGEPHPIVFFRKFLALAQDGKLDPAVAARAPELSGMMNRWQHAMDDSKDDKPGDGDQADVKRGSKGGKHDDFDFDFDRVVTALPLPLEGIGAKLYQLAWEEKFDDAKVEAKLRALQPDDLERRDLFKRFDWVFYLPPKGAFDRVLDDLIAEALKQEDVGFFGRVMVKGALLVVKPKIRRAIEAMRQGMMFLTVVQAQTQYSEKEVKSLTGALIEAIMPFSEKKTPGATDHERAVNAVRERLRKLAETAKPAAIPAPPATVPAKPVADPSAKP